MDSLSEDSQDSFAWTNASSDDNNSDIDTMSVENKMQNHHEDESESDKNYKGRLQKELLKDKNESDSHETESHRKAKKRKIKVETMESEDSESPRKKRIKSEPKSDIDNSGSKDRKHNNGNEIYNSQDLAHEESYLNLKVKQETNATRTPTKSKKNKSIKRESDNYEEFDNQHESVSSNTLKSKRVSDAESTDDSLNMSSIKRKSRDLTHEGSYLNLKLKQETFATPTTVKSKKKKSKKKESDVKVEFDSQHESESSDTLKSKRVSDAENTDDSINMSDIKRESEDANNSRIKKKKSKRNKDKDKDDMVIDKFSAEETVVETRRLNQTNLDENEYDYANEDLDDSKSKKRKSKKKHVKENMVTENMFSAEETIVEMRRHSYAKLEKNEFDYSEEDLDNSRNKTKKSNKKDISFVYNDMIIEDKFSADETVVQTPPKKRRKSVNETLTNSHASDNNSTINNSIKGSNLGNKQINSYKSKEIINDDSSSDEETNKSNVNKSNFNNSTLNKIRNQNEDIKGSDSDSSVNEIVNQSMPGKTLKRAMRISDRIRFEDEEDSYMETTQYDQEDIKYSSIFKNYLKKHKLKPISTKLNNDFAVTQDDEIWVLKCPQEMDINGLKDTNLALDGKCKVKTGSHTFNGIVNEDTDRIPIFSFEDNKYVINNIPLKGTIHFHKRIPKTHYVDDNVLVNNQTNFIPLPETKCRHPLFGPDYKRATKIPAEVAERLKASEHETPDIPERKKKKKHKRDRYKSEIKPEVEVKVEPEQEEIVSKNRKRKYTENEETKPKKAKRKKIKHDPDSSEVWESAAAIEENLFNF